MRPRRFETAVLLTGVWLLLRPPIDRIEPKAATTVMDAAPLVIWEQVGHYESREACERTRDEVIEKVRGVGSEADTSQVWLVTRWLHARCVPEESLPR